MRTVLCMNSVGTLMYTGRAQVIGSGSARTAWRGGIRRTLGLLAWLWGFGLVGKLGAGTAYCMCDENSRGSLMTTAVQRAMRVTYSLTEPILCARPLPAMPTTTKSASCSLQKSTIISPGLMLPLPSNAVTEPSTCCGGGRVESAATGERGAAREGARTKTGRARGQG